MTDKDMKTRWTIDAVVNDVKPYTVHVNAPTLGNAIIKATVRLQRFGRVHPLQYWDRKESPTVAVWHECLGCIGGK